MSEGTPSLGGGYPMPGGTPCLGGNHVREVPHLCPPHFTEQHSEHLLRGGQCASCVHAGGLSCLQFFSENSIIDTLN